MRSYRIAAPTAQVKRGDRVNARFPIGRLVRLGPKGPLMAGEVKATHADMAWVLWDHKSVVEYEPSIMLVLEATK